MDIFEDYKKDLKEDFHCEDLPFEFIRVYLTKKIEIPTNSYLIEKNPYLGLEIWHNSRQEQIVVGKNFLIIRSHYQVNIHYLLSISNEEMYGIIRQKLHV